MTTLTLGWLAIAGGLVTPLLTGLFTKIKATPQLQAVMTFCLSAGIGAGQTVLSAPHTGVKPTHLVTTILSTWFLAIVAHYGLWKPTGASAAVQNVAPNFGLNDAPTDVAQPALVASPELLQQIAEHLGVEPEPSGRATLVPQTGSSAAAPEVV